MVLDDAELNYEAPDCPVPEVFATRMVRTHEIHGLQPNDVQQAVACLDRPLERRDLPPARRHLHWIARLESASATPEPAVELRGDGPMPAPPSDPLLGSSPLVGRLDGSVEFRTACPPSGEPHGPALSTVALSPQMDGSVEFEPLIEPPSPMLPLVETVDATPAQAAVFQLSPKAPRKPQEPQPPKGEAGRLHWTESLRSCLQLCMPAPESSIPAA